MEGLWFGIDISIAIFGCSKEYKSLALHGTRYIGSIQMSYEFEHGLVAGHLLADPSIAVEVMKHPLVSHL